jgi:hypothetical protein
VANLQFWQPEEVACFSRTGDGALHFDSRKLVWPFIVAQAAPGFNIMLQRQFQMPAEGSDLNQGFESFIQKSSGWPRNCALIFLCGLQSYLP